MIDFTFESILHYLTTNPMVLGFMLASLIPTAFYFLRSVPSKIIGVIQRVATVTVTVHGSHMRFHQISDLLAEHSVAWMSKRRILNKNELSLGEAATPVLYNGVLLIVRRNVHDTNNSEFRESLQIDFYCRPKTAHKTMLEILAQVNVDEEFLLAYSMEKYGLELCTKFRYRAKESVFVSGAIMQEVESRIDAFIAGEDKYAELGVPYKLGMLFHGQAGTGKTTLAKYIASYTKKDIVMINPNNLSGATGYELFEGSGRVYVIEDIDCYNVARDREAETASGNTSSNLLNWLDGIAAPYGAIIIATTNHIDNLDDAMTRKGRFDYKAEIGLMELPEIEKMIEHFCGDRFTDRFSELPQHAKISGAELQDILLTQDDPISCIIDHTNGR